MRLSICTISFRHHLQSIDQLAKWAQFLPINGIELWGIHAKNLKTFNSYNKDWLQEYGLHVSMISDYLPLHLSKPELEKETQELSELANRWGTNKLRTFAGQKASADTNNKEREMLAQKLKKICEQLAEEGQLLLLETHPQTLTDNVESTLRLLEEVNHPALKVNFDVLHIWESGADPIEAFQTLRPWIHHFHLKNISSKEKLSVFQPANVYAAAGTREGMVPLFEGILDYESFISYASAYQIIDASLEWFGGNVQTTIASDAYKIAQLHKRMQKRVI